MSLDPASIRAEFFEQGLPPIGFRLGHAQVGLMNWGYMNTQEKAWANDSHHHHFYELCILSEGHGTFLTEGRPQTLHAGDVYAVGPRTDHRVQADEGGLGLYCASFSITPHRHCDESALDGWVDQWLSLDHFSVHVEGAIPHAQRITEQLRQRLPGYEQAMTNYFSALLISIIQQLVVLRPDDMVTPLRVHLGEDRITQALHFIQANFQTRFSEDALAEHVNLSKRHLNRLFKTQFNQPVMQYVNTYRFRMAQQLLDATHYSITDIAHKCGFPNARHFMTQFKRHTGQTPTDFRHTRNRPSQAAPVKEESNHDQ